MDATVVICTHNGSRRLRAAVTETLKQDYPTERWEILIVDNCSTDDTVEVANSLTREAPDRIRLVQEPELGLSAARNTGARSARGDIIVFLDDDAIPKSGWLQSLVEGLREDDVQAGGGPVEGVFETPLPDWIVEHYLPYLTVWEMGECPMPLTYNEYPRGANIAFRREAFERFGRFSTHLGRKGTRLLSCEEIEFCLRIERAGERILYIPQASVMHRVDADRLTRRWMEDRFAAQAESEAIINWMHGGFKALWLGLQVCARNARSVPHSEGQDFSRRCWKRAFRSYLWMLPRAVLSIPTYDAEDRPTGRWLPPH